MQIIQKLLWLMIFLIIFLLCCNNQSNAYTAKFGGYIYDASDDSIIENAAIEVNSNTYYSDSTGNFKISIEYTVPYGVTNDQYCKTFTISKDGYITQNILICEGELNKIIKLIKE